MAFYTDTFMEKHRDWLRKNINKVEVMVGSTWHTGTIQAKYTSTSGVYVSAVFDDLTDAACTITSLRVLDLDGEVVAQQSENITKAAGQGVLICLSLPITEEE